MTRWHYWQGNRLAIHRSRVSESWLGTSALWPSASYLHPCASLTKQYNLVPAKGPGCISLAGKVTTGLVESNSNLSPGLYLVIKYGTTFYFSFLLFFIVNINKNRLSCESVMITGLNEKALCRAHTPAKANNDTIFA